MTRKTLPAILGGNELFKEKIPITVPTLTEFKNIEGKVKNIFKTRMVTNSGYVTDFEKKLAKYIGVRDAVCVSSCTSGLILVLKALELKGEVIVPSFTFFATVHSLAWNNLRPVFIDCDSFTYNIDAGKI